MDKFEELNKRISRMLNDEEFRSYCKRCKNTNPNFEEEFSIAEQIANININNIQIDYSLLNVSNDFTNQQIENGVLGFYRYIDELAPSDKNLEQQVLENRKYFTTDNHGDKTARSFCSSAKTEDGREERIIFLNPEGRVGDISTAIHEFCHSLSKTFLECKAPKDENMAEIPTVITDALSNYYLQNNMPSYAENFIENEINTQVINVIKGREALLDGLIIKLMLGEETLNNVVKKYGNMYLSNTRILENCLKKIETYKFSNMHEIKYLVPQALALNVLERFKRNPKETAKLFKEVLAHDVEWTVEETLKYLNLPSKQELVNDYILKFEERIEKLKINKERLQEDFLEY